MTSTSYLGVVFEIGQNEVITDDRFIIKMTPTYYVVFDFEIDLINLLKL